MKEAFTLFDPTEHIDFMHSKIRKLENNNFLLIICVVVVACVAVYFANKYHQLKEDSD